MSWSMTDGGITVPCPLCGSSERVEVLVGPDYFMHLPGIFHLVRCQRCALLYQSPRPSLAEIGRYYPDTYGSYTSAQTGLRARRGLIGRVIRRGLERRCRLLDQIVPEVDGRHRRLLDVGCASGLFLEAMLKYRWQVEGVELNATAAQATSARLNIPVYAGPLEQARYADASFDAVTLWDVLEHLHDPLASLRELRRILRPGGAIFLRVPNAASYVARWWGRYWSGYDLPRHMTLFTPSTLTQMLAEAGFSAPLRSYSSGSYLAALHSLRFAMDDGRVNRARAAAIHRVLLHPVMRAFALVPFTVADRIAQGSNLEILALARSS